ncbi:MAG: response regulator [Phycisphaerales bacterium]
MGESLRGDFVVTKEQEHVRGAGEGTSGSARPGGRVAPTGEGAPEFEVDASLATLALSLLSAIGEGVGLATRAGRILWANDMLAALPSNMRERVAVQCRQFEHDHPLPPRDVSLPAGWLLPRSETTMAESDRFFELMLTPVSPATIQTIGPAVSRWADCLVVVLRDVSSSRRLQQRIDAIDQAGSELMRFEEDVVRKYNAVERLKLLEDKIIRYARDLLHFDHFAIRLLDQRSGKLELVIGYGIGTDYDAFVIRPGLEGHGITGYVAASGRSYVCEDTGADPLYLPGVVDAKSSLTVPLRLHDRVIGVMNVESQQPKAFGDEERQLGEIFARYIAVSLHMLDLLVVERSTVNQAVSGRVETELREPLEDIAHEIDILEHQHAKDPEDIAHLERIKKDLASIRARLQQCMAGPAGLLGVEQAMHVTDQDPVIAGRRVLVADDEQRIRAIISGVLERRGATVVCAESGTEAIEQITRAGSQGFDMIVSDIRMDGANGYEVFAAARKENAGVKVILMTGFGYDPHHSIVRASQEGLQSVLFKPFQVERLVEEVRKAMVK